MWTLAVNGWSPLFVPSLSLSLSWLASKLDPILAKSLNWIKYSWSKIKERRVRGFWKVGTLTVNRWSLYSSPHWVGSTHRDQTPLSSMEYQHNCARTTSANSQFLNLNLYKCTPALISNWTILQVDKEPFPKLFICTSIIHYFEAPLQWTRNTWHTWMFTLA